MRAHLLPFIKHAVNAWAKSAVKVVPRITAKRPVGSLVKQLFGLLKKSAGMHPREYYEDRNYPRLLEALEKTLVFISEEDDHYAGHLAQAMLLVHYLVAYTRRKFPAGREGDVAWIRWASGAQITRVKQTEVLCC